ncbi:serine/threonine protein kinase [Bordetella flabilis]|uniref:serine/threonine protein kinase n=1 Tax=Bordetella flabilis TaxID=463014 RepID=UPI0012F4ABB7|nr:serine/threonine protein kinase [Bordetella flabilis]
MSVSRAFVPEVGHPAPEPFGYRPLAAIAAAAAGGVPQKRIGRVLAELAPGLIAVHQQGKVHGAISVQTVGLDEFGHAHLLVPALYPDHSGAMEPASCFAAAEQFDPEPASACGPWTDVYALSAVACSLISGSPPPHALARRAQDNYVPLAIRRPKGYDEAFLGAVDRGLSMTPAQRPQSIADLYTALGVPYAAEVGVAPLAPSDKAFVPAANDGVRQGGAGMERRRRAAGVLAVVAGVVAVAGVWAWMNGDDAPEDAGSSPIVMASRPSTGPGNPAVPRIGHPAALPVAPAGQGVPGVPAVPVPGTATAPLPGPAPGAGVSAGGMPASPPSGAAPLQEGANGGVAENAPATAPAKPARPVAVTVNLDVRPWGEIFVDGKSRGVSPPLKTLSLPAGRHTVVVRNADLPAYRVVVDLKPGQPLTLRHVFQ